MRQKIAGQLKPRAGQLKLGIRYRKPLKQTRQGMEKLFLEKKEELAKLAQELNQVCGKIPVSPAETISIANRKGHSLVEMISIAQKSKDGLNRKLRRISFVIEICRKRLAIEKNWRERKKESLRQLVGELRGHNVKIPRKLMQQIDLIMTGKNHGKAKGYISFAIERCLDLLAEQRKNQTARLLESREIGKRQELLEEPREKQARLLESRKKTLRELVEQLERNRGEKSYISPGLRMRIQRALEEKSLIKKQGEIESLIEELERRTE